MNYRHWLSGLILLLAVIGVLLPSQAKVAREQVVGAHPATIFALLNDFEQVSKWSPWIELDPDVQLVFTGPQRGIGATMSWDGQIIGSGQQSINNSEPYTSVGSSIESDRWGTVNSSFVLADDGGATRVTWNYEQEFGFNLLARYLGLALDSKVGPEMTSGLLRLKTLAESLPAIDFSDLDVEHLSVEAIDVAYRTTTSVPEATAISEAMGRAYFEVLGFIDRHSLSDAGAPMSITRAFSGSELVFEAAIPVRGISDATPRSSETVQIGKTYAGPAIRVAHVGTYRKLGDTHNKIAAYLAALGIERNGDAWESYVSDPTRIDETELLTYIYYPITEAVTE